MSCRAALIRARAESPRVGERRRICRSDHRNGCCRLALPSSTTRRTARYLLAERLRCDGRNASARPRPILQSASPTLDHRSPAGGVVPPPAGHGGHGRDPRDRRPRRGANAGGWRQPCVRDRWEWLALGRGSQRTRASRRRDHDAATRTRADLGARHNRLCGYTPRIRDLVRTTRS